MRFTNRVKLTLLICLIALNIILRVPTTPHELGFDSFFIHILANSISTFGEAKWWVNPLSIVGFYPLSYASSVPFILSGVSLCTAMNVELVILLYGMILGFFSIFVGYSLARVIWNNDIFKFLVALAFSTSQGILTYSTWTANARTLFVIMLPLFVYLLLKVQTFKMRCGILTFIILMLLFATHNYIFFVIPIIICYFVIVILYKLGKYINIKSIKNSENLVNIAVFASFFIIFLIPFFFTRTLWEGDPELMRAGIGSHYTVVFSLVYGYVRYIGFLSILLVGGYVYLFLKRKKRFEEWFLLITLVSLTPLLYVQTYMKFFIISFASLLIGIAFTNIATLGAQKTKTQVYKNTKRYLALSVIILLILASVSFTGYYQYLHFTIKPPPYDRYMKEQTYIGGLWIRDNIDKNLFYDDHVTALRTFAISEVPTLCGAAVGLSYGFYNDITDINISKNSPLSVAYYKLGPYVRTPHTYHIEGTVEFLSERGIDSRIGKHTIPKYNLSYVIENEGKADNVFIRSVHPEKNNLYDNGKIRIWRL